MKTELIQVSPTVRIESGKPRVVAKATEAMLNSKYLPKHYKVGAFDASGKRRITLDKEFEYIDWKSREVVWNTYKLTEYQTLHKDGTMRTGTYYRRAGVYSTKAEAERAAELLKEPEE